MKNKTRQIIMGAVILLTVLCLAFIFGNSLKDSVESSEQSTAVKEFLMNIASLLGFEGDISVSTLRSFAHVAEFCMLGGCLGVLAMYLSRRNGSTSGIRCLCFLLAAVGTGVFFAVVDELLQLVSVGRMCDIEDVMLDTVGIVIGVAVGTLAYFLFIKLINCRKNREKDKI